MSLNGHCQVVDPAKPRHDFLDACAESTRLYPIYLSSTSNHAASRPQEIPHSIGFSGRQRSLDCQRRLPLYFPCASSSQLRNLSENNLNNISSLKIYYLIRGNLRNWAFLFAIFFTSCLYHDVSSRSLNFLSCARVIPTCAIAANGGGARELTIQTNTAMGSTCAG